MKDALKLAKEGEGHAPELFLSLVEERKKFVPNGDNDSFRAIVSQIRATATALQWQNDSGSSRAGAELGIIEHQLKAVQQVSSTQLKLITDLERDVDLFTKTMNQRLEFYRQLQGLSDQLSPWKEELDETLDLPALQKQQAEQAKSEHKLSGLNTKRRYLTHLQHESTTQNARICVICQTQFDIGWPLSNGPHIANAQEVVSC